MTHSSALIQHSSSACEEIDALSASAPANMTFPSLS